MSVPSSKSTVMSVARTSMSNATVAGGNADELLLQRYGDAALDFLRRHAGAFRMIFTCVVDTSGKASIGSPGRDDPGGDEQYGQHERQQTLRQREADQVSSIIPLPTPEKMALSPETPLIAIRSSAPRPSTMTPSPL